MNAVPLLLEPQHLDYIVAFLQHRCVWAEANPILVAITQQVQAQAKTQPTAHQGNGSAHRDEPLEALP